MYRNMFRTSILRAIYQLYRNEPSYFQQDGAPSHHHRDIRSYHYETQTDHWIGRKGSVEYPSHSPSNFTSKVPEGWGHIVKNYWHQRCYGKKLEWLPMHYSANSRVYKLMVGTLNTCSGSASVAAISFCVYQIQMINILFQQTFVCWIVYTFLCPSVYILN